MSAASAIAAYLVTITRENLSFKNPLMLDIPAYGSKISKFTSAVKTTSVSPEKLL